MFIDTESFSQIFNLYRALLALVFEIAGHWITSSSIKTFIKI